MSGSAQVMGIEAWHEVARDERGGHRAEPVGLHADDFAVPPDVWAPPHSGSVP
jgi:hypothetical protein